MNRIEITIFGAMTVYIIAVIITYFRMEPIQGYEIQIGSLSVAKTYTGIAIRQEELLRSPYTGYINYYIREGERVSSRDTVYSVDESGKLASLLNTGNMEDSSYTDAELSELRSEVIQYDRMFDCKEFRSVYYFKYELEGTVLKLANISMYEHMETLNQSSLGGMVSLCSAGKTGYVVYSTDGYEGLTPEQITPEMFDQSKYEKSRVNNNDLIEKNATVGKLVTDENWSLIIPVEKDRSAVLEEEEYVKVKFVKTQETSWGQVTIHHLADGDYAQLTFNNSCVAFCTVGYVDIELILDEVKGLKIPQSAIVEKEFYIIPAEYMTKGGPNGNYGVLKEKADENGNLVSSFIETTVYSSDDKEFYIDSIDIKVGEYGLTVYDRIVLDASSVKNYDFTYK